MNRIILIILLAVNLLAAVIYLVFQISRGQKRKGLVIFLFLLFAPVVGGLFSAVRRRNEPAAVPQTG